MVIYILVSNDCIVFLTSFLTFLLFFPDTAFSLVFLSVSVPICLVLGNVLVQLLPNGEPRLVILDCGIVYSAPTKAEHDKLVDICLAFMKHDGYSAGKLMVENAVARQLSLKEDTMKTIFANKLTEKQQLLQDERKKRILEEKVHNAEEFCHAINQIVIDAC
jgi:predicted unusual protein kinase regulating ubiquinone biosynthesis (AarF/ABC1/UbiB family)